MRRPRAAFGVASYYTDWMDTAESERLLRDQRHTFATFRRDLARRLRPVRGALAPLRPLVWRSLLRFSGPWRSRSTIARRR
jgi:hypothetical protein